MLDWGLSVLSFRSCVVHIKVNGSLICITSSKWRLIKALASSPLQVALFASVCLFPQHEDHGGECRAGDAPDAFPSFIAPQNELDTFGGRRRVNAW